MATVQNILNQELSKGNSIAWWVTGYYLTSGNVHSPSLKVPIFGMSDFISKHSNYPPPNRTVKVLIDYLGSMIWINLRFHQLHFGYGGKNAPSPEGKELRCKLEAIKT